MGRCKNCVVIPALNEEETIYSVVRSMQAFAEVIVVNDGSSDGTVDQIKRAGAILINNDVSRGYVASLKMDVVTLWLRGTQISLRLTLTESTLRVHPSVD